MPCKRGCTSTPISANPFEHIGHFVNGWLRRSAQAKAKRDSSPVFQQVGTGKPARASTSTSRETAKLKKVAQAISSIKTIGSETAIQDANPMEPKQPTPVSQALVQAKSPGTDSKQ
jgi:hypothetical protein